MFGPSSDKRSTKPLTMSLWAIGALGFIAGGFAALGDPRDARSARQALAERPRPVARITPGADVPPPVREQAVTRTEVPSEPAPAATPTPKPEQPGAEVSASTGRRSLWAIMLLVVVAGLALLFARKQKAVAESGSPRLDIIETARVGRYRVSLVRADDRVLVVGASDKGLVLLSEYDVAPLDAAVELATAAEAVAAAEPAPTRQEDAASIDAPPADRAFLDHLVQRLTTATPASLRDIVGSGQAPRTAGPGVARYRTAAGA